MKILVTGGAGFIGSAVIRHIINNTDDSVINIDKLTYAGCLDNIKEVSGSERYLFEKVDICNNSEMTRVFQEHRPDRVMHLAAESHVDRSINGSHDFIKTNIVGTYNLLEVCREYYSSLSKEEQMRFKFHHVSTDEVYGDLPHPQDCEYEDLPLFSEQTSYSPSSPYSASKASSDHLVRAWHRTYGLPVVITNCSNNYGPYHFPEKLIPLTILNALSEKHIPVYGDGSQIRDWLYVDDHARALYTVLTKGLLGETYNIGGHNEKKNIDVVNEILLSLEELCTSHRCALANGGAGFKSLIEFVTDRPGHDLRYAIDATKIEKELGWIPQESFETGIRKTVVWFLNNKEWLKAMSSKK